MDNAPLQTDVTVIVRYFSRTVVNNCAVYYYCFGLINLYHIIHCFVVGVVVYFCCRCLPCRFGCGDAVNSLRPAVCMQSSTYPQLLPVEIAAQYSLYSQVNFSCTHTHTHTHIHMHARTHARTHAHTHTHTHTHIYIYIYFKASFCLQHHKPIVYTVMHSVTDTARVRKCHDLKRGQGHGIPTAFFVPPVAVSFGQGTQACKADLLVQRRGIR